MLAENYDKYRTQNNSIYILAAKQMRNIRKRCYIVMINWSSILYGENELLKKKASCPSVCLVGLLSVYRRPTEYCNTQRLQLDIKSNLHPFFIL